MEEKGTGTAMQPFVMRELVAMVMSRKRLPMEDALHYVCSSRLYRDLLDETTKLWYAGTLYLFDELEREKRARRRRTEGDPDRMLFRMYCFEEFRRARGMDAVQVLRLFSEHRIFEFLDENYGMLHTQDARCILETVAGLAGLSGN